MTWNGRAAGALLGVVAVLSLFVVVSLLPGRAEAPQAAAPVDPIELEPAPGDLIARCGDDGGSGVAQDRTFAYCLSEESIVLADALQSWTAGSLDGSPTVALTFIDGPTGIDLVNDLAPSCLARSPDRCPTGQVAVVFGRAVLSAPTIAAPSFAPDQIVVANPLSTDRMIPSDVFPDAVAQSTLHPVLWTAPLDG
ncbi:MAG: hypothetical protein AAF547_07265 [Actinomycetota bacterium]